MMGLKFRVVVGQQSSESVTDFDRVSERLLEVSSIRNLSQRFCVFAAAGLWLVQGGRPGQVLGQFNGPA